MHPEWVRDGEYEGPERRSGTDRRNAAPRSGPRAGPAPESQAGGRSAAAARRAGRSGGSSRESQLLAALLALVDGETLEPSEEGELLREGLVTRGSLAHGFQLTLRGTQMVQACSAGDYWPAPEDPSGDS